MAGKQKISQYRKPVNFNIGMIIFAVIFIYIIICVFIFFTQKHIVPYEVKVGSLSANNIYRGIALRDETVVTAEQAGYINYLVREGNRSGAGNPVYAVDQLGELSEYISNADPGENTLSDADLNELRTEIVGFVHSFSETNFDVVYDFKYDIQGTVLKLDNHNVLQGIEAINSSGAQQIFFGRAPRSGIVVYSLDGYEALTPDQITLASFDETQYEKVQLLGNELIGSGDPVFKLSTSEDWSIVIAVDPAKADELIAAEFIQVRFLKNQNVSWAEVIPLSAEGEDTFIELRFTNSMINFCTDRYIDIELITEEETGLKIPNSAIVEKEFFLVPKEYLTRGGNNNAYGVLMERFTENGEQTTEFVETTIYGETEADYYLDDMILRIGDYLIKPDSADKVSISRQQTLIGVYNINQGYADFKQIIILYKNEEYSIVRSNTKYGLGVFDYIVLDAATVNENELIYI